MTIKTKRTRQSTIMSKARFRAFMGGQSVASAMVATPVPIVQVMRPGAVGTGTVAPCPMAP